MQQTLKHLRLQARHKTVVLKGMPVKHGIFFLLLLSIWSPLSVRSEESAAPSSNDTSHLTHIIRALCAHLKIDEQFEVRIDKHNAKMVSSEPLPGPTRVYRISFDQQFLDSLSEDEINAAIAHELGHVWIFSHHPYLQTEALANEIALRVVDRNSLKKVYAKMWAHTGTAGNIDELLGADPADETPKAATILR